MDLIDIVFLIYTFAGLYMLSLFFFVYILNRKKIFEHPKCKLEPVSIVIPCYNEAEHIGKTLECLQKLDYPQSLIEIIIVDDCSKDNSIEIIKKYIAKFKNIMLITSKKNSGGAAIPTNIGIKSAKSKYAITLDAETYPDPGSIKKMLGLLQEDEKVAAVTGSILTRHQNSWIQKMQAIEYDITSLFRKILDLVDSVYVTPGAFAMYRKEAVIKAGLFDPSNLTQDIEMVWRLLSKGYKARMSLAAKAHTETPYKFKDWWNQRNRWNIGGTQTLLKYKSLIFKKGMLGNFIIPYFAISLILSILGIFLFIFMIIKNISIYYLVTKYSLFASASLLTLRDLAVAPSIMSYFGIALFILGLWMTFFSLGIMRYLEPKKRNVLNIIMFLFIYSFIYPLIMIDSKSKMIRGIYKW
ncbi:glycosyltransferase family 2 protein [Candidatus Pacearchaeota archaeon]|nr:glycosyltransferase family 2 protein [Candidatus Pacearchaeota archaeon]